MKDYDKEIIVLLVFILTILFIILSDKYANAGQVQVTLKDEHVSLVHFTKEMLEGLLVAQSCANEQDIELIITSGSDGDHKRGSKHYEGNALDYRILWWTRKQRDIFYECLVLNSSRDFDVVYEGNHIHHEYDPRDNDKHEEEK